MKIKNTYKLFGNENDIKGIMIVVHGMCEHHQRYDYFAQKVSEQGLLVLTYDQQGHGQNAKNNNELGYFGKDNGWFSLIDDLDTIVQQIKVEYPNIPVILFGHSMGSQVVRSYIKKYSEKVQGVILSGVVSYQVAAKAGIYVAKLFALFNEKGTSKLLRKLCEGSFNKQIKNAVGDSDWLSKNPQNIIDYKADELCGFAFTNRGYVNLLFGNSYMHSLKDCTNINENLSILTITGADDPCVGYEKGLDDSIKTLNKMGFNKVESKVYEELRHEILNEIEKDDVINDVVEWLNRKF